ICIKVDIDENPPLAEFFGAQAVPTMVFADPWGNELNRRVGFTKPNELLSIMRYFPSNFLGVKDSMATLEKDNKNTDALSRVGDFYKGAGAIDVSNRFYERALKTDGAKNDQVRENIYIKMGVNHLRMKRFDDAKKMFEKCLKEVPDGKQSDMALLGL